MTPLSMHVITTRNGPVLSNFGGTDDDSPCSLHQNRPFPAGAVQGNRF